MIIEYLCLFYKQFLCEIYLTMAPFNRVNDYYSIYQQIKNWSDVMILAKKFQKTFLSNCRLLRLAGRIL